MFQPRIHEMEISLENGKLIEYKLLAMGKYENLLRRKILKFKYYGYKNIGHDFAELICKKVSYNSINSFDYLLPVPPRPSSLSERSYDHVLLLGEYLSESFDLPLARDILVSLERPSQMDLNRPQRFANVKGAFSLKNPYPVEEKKILVLDDIYTTGATLGEVIKTLSTTTSQIINALVLAKTELA